MARHDRRRAPALTRRRPVAGLGAAAAASLVGLGSARRLALKCPGAATVPVTTVHDRAAARGTANKGGRWTPGADRSARVGPS